MIDTRIASIVDDWNEIIVHYKTKFKYKEENDAVIVSYAGKDICYIQNWYTEDTFVHISIPNCDIRVDLGLLFGESIVVSKCVAHILLDKILHTNTVSRMIYKEVIGMGD